MGVTQSDLALNKIHEGDCLELMKRIPSGSVDMILCDLPYGTTACKWDSIIPFEPLWAEYERIIKDDGAIVLTASQPFTAKLISSNIKHFRYCWYWIKGAPTGFAFAKKQPMRDVEEVLVFYKSRHNYYPQGLVELETPVVKNRKVGGQGEVLDPGGLTNKPYVTTHTNYPKNTLMFKPQREGLHPTQKPVALFEYLIRTYTKEGEVVLDNCMGSGTTAVAAINTGRQFIGIERESKYVEVANRRIHDAINSKNNE